MCEIIDQYARDKAEDFEIRKDAEIRKIKQVAEQALVLAGQAEERYCPVCDPL